ncbi:MAG: PTS sugar transporter subunit IIB [Nitrospirota bacterium]|nr:PTS sugar transporter subunit IIB [Nitrospirota bacterium]
MVILARIDDRLIHGQVVEGWVNFLKATCIMVADDKIAANPLQRSIMEISVPPGLKVVIGTVKEICAKLREGIPEEERTILLFSNPDDVLRSLKEGLSCSRVNVGGLHFVPGKRKIMDVLAVDETDLAALKEIMDRGIKVEIQTVPSEKPQPLDRVFRLCLGT